MGKGNEKVKAVGSVVSGAVGPSMVESLQVGVGKVEFANGAIGEGLVMMELDEEVATAVADSTVKLAVKEFELPVGDGETPVPVPVPVPGDPGPGAGPVPAGPATLKLE